MTLTVPTSDGRLLEVLVFGPEDGTPLVFHNGLPSAAVPFPQLERVADVLGLRVVTWSRPGYGRSTPRTDGTTTYRVADDVADTVTVLDGLGIGSFVTLGWSGGGPRALACAALQPERCRAAATLAGVGPYGVDGLDFVADMGPENVRDFHASLQGAEALEAVLLPEIDAYVNVSGDEIVAAFGGLVSDVDAAALTGELADYVAADFRASVRQGVVGMRDDSLAIVRPWGFDVAAIDVPVSVWQGRQDLMVPYTHGVWLADHVPGARRHLYDEEGHLSLVAQLDRVLEDLLDLAGLTREA
jgi:pimeloyl-ACP methyl ester carboxylesterase